MGAGARPGAHHAAPAAHLAPTAQSHHHSPADEAPPAPRDQRHGGNHDCLMMLGCGVASIRSARLTAIVRMPIPFVRAGLVANPIPVAADLAVEPPPPRQTI